MPRPMTTHRSTVQRDERQPVQPRGERGAHCGSAARRRGRRDRGPIDAGLDALSSNRATKASVARFPVGSVPGDERTAPEPADRRLDLHGARPDGGDRALQPAFPAAVQVHGQRRSGQRSRVAAHKPPTTSGPRRRSCRRRDCSGTSSTQRATTGRRPPGRSRPRRASRTPSRSPPPSRFPPVRVGADPLELRERLVDRHVLVAERCTRRSRSRRDNEVGPGGHGPRPRPRCWARAPGSARRRRAAGRPAARPRPPGSRHDLRVGEARDLDSRSPAAIRRSTSSTLRGVVTKWSSDCSPSRGPTSHDVTSQRPRPCPRPTVLSAPASARCRAWR